MVIQNIDNLLVTSFIEILVRKGDEKVNLERMVVDTENTKAKVE